MPKSLDCFLPHYENDHRRIQADIGLSIVREANRIRRRKKLTWNEVMSGCLQKFNDDYKATEENPEPVQVDMFK